MSLEDYYYRKRDRRVPEGPGEGWDQIGLPAQAQAQEAIPARAGIGQILPVPAHINSRTGRALDMGARVGIMRNLEFSAGGRAHRISKGSYSKA